MTPGEMAQRGATLGAAMAFAQRWLGWRYLPAALLLVGVAFRLVWAAAHDVPPRSGEMMNAAVAFAQTGIIADAFAPGQGPTAHLMPIPIVYAGLVYRWFGLFSPVAEMILAATATLLVAGSYALFYRAFGLIGTPRPARRLALAFLCLVPVYMALETMTFRVWEGALAVFLGAAYLVALLEAERAQMIGWGRVAAMSLLAALLFFVSPPMGVAAYVASLWLLVERLAVRRWPGAALMAMGALALFIAPWAARNQAVMGAPVLLRSNFGLELALANHPAAVAGGDARQVFRDRLEEIHPFESADAFARLKAMGEIAYAKALGDEAKAWIATHPAAFFRLCGRHIVQFFLPPAWLWTVYSPDGGVGLAAKVAIQWALSIAGLAGATWATWRAGRRYRFAILMLVLPVLPYMIVQPVLRYRYLLFALLVYFSADMAARLWARLASASHWGPGAPSDR